MSNIIVLSTQWGAFAKYIQSYFINDVFCARHYCRKQYSEKKELRLSRLLRSSRITIKPRHNFIREFARAATRTCPIRFSPLAAGVLKGKHSNIYNYRAAPWIKGSSWLFEENNWLSSRYNDRDVVLFRLFVRMPARRVSTPFHAHWSHKSNFSRTFAFYEIFYFLFSRNGKKDTIHTIVHAAKFFSETLCFIFNTTPRYSPLEEVIWHVANVFNFQLRSDKCDILYYTIIEYIYKREEGNKKYIY